jgi:DNA-binding transcriptional ArsR family regulator
VRTEQGLSFPWSLFIESGLFLCLTYILKLEYIKYMSRTATTPDVFYAIAEPRRREIIGLLNDGREWAVNDVVARVRMAQPAVSKHLGVLRRVGVVTVVKRGQHRLYRLHAAQLMLVYDWVKTYERYWTHQISRILERAEQKALDRIARENEQPDPKS